MIYRYPLFSQGYFWGMVGEQQFQQFCQGRSGTGEKETHYINVVGKKLRRCSNMALLEPPGAPKTSQSTHELPFVSIWGTLARFGIPFGVPCLLLAPLWLHFSSISEHFGPFGLHLDSPSEHFGPFCTLLWVDPRLTADARNEGLLCRAPAELLRNTFPAGTLPLQQTSPTRPGAEHLPKATWIRSGLGVPEACLGECLSFRLDIF